MVRRILAAALWAYFGWYLASYITVVAGLPSALAISGAVAMAVIAWVDLRRLRPGKREQTEAEPA